MLISPKSRYFVRHELVFRPARNRGAGLPFVAEGRALDVADVIESAIAAGVAVLKLKDNDVVALTKLDLRPDDDLAVMLFRRSDPDAATPIFEHQQTKRLRPSDKKVYEAEAISAHLFIRLKPVAGENPTYRAVLEEMPGLGRTYMQALLKELLNKSRYNYTDENGEKHETYTIPVFEGLQSESLGDALKAGEIQYVELVRPPRISGLDVAGLIPHPERMRLTIKAKSRSAMLGAIAKVKDWSSDHGWPRLRVRVGTGDNRSRIVEIARTQDAADVLFVHSEPVETKRPMEQCTDVVNEELVDHAQRFFASRSGWG